MKDEFDFRELNRIIHSPVRLGIMAAMVSSDEVNFRFLKEKLELSDGNLSANMTKLEEAGFIIINKSFVNKKPVTTYRVTELGQKAFRKYIENIEKIIRS